MHPQLPTWQFIQKSLHQHVGVVLMYVLSSKGSSPGRQGFFMAVNQSGEMYGSLGGGIMEHKFVELAKSKLAQSVKGISVHRQLHDKQAASNQSGMICSGEQTIFVCVVTHSDKGGITALIQSLENNKNGRLQLSLQGISFSEDPPLNDFILEVRPGGDFLYMEKTGYKNHLYIIGGGHCALSLSRLMKEMDFFVHLYDDRPALNTVEQNHFADEIKVVGDYSVLPGMIPSGKNIYVVIMTVGYRTDAVALKALAIKEFQFLGILGSKNKIAKMFTDLARQGIPPQVFDRIHAPVGLQIKSQTPGEIAVSIAAEIIAVKNKDLF